MILQWYCSMCGKTHEKDIPQDKPLPTIEEVVKSERGWIVQHNGPHFDIYCSEKCAE